MEQRLEINQEPCRAAQLLIGPCDLSRLSLAEEFRRLCIVGVPQGHGVPNVYPNGNFPTYGFKFPSVPNGNGNGGNGGSGGNGGNGGGFGGNGGGFGGNGGGFGGNGGGFGGNGGGFGGNGGGFGGNGGGGGNLHIGEFFF